MSNLSYQPGIYRVRTTTWGLGTSSGGYPQFVIKFIPLGMVDQADPDAGLHQCPNLERTIYRTITDKSVDYVIADLRKLGWHGENWGELNSDSNNAANFRDVEFDARCNHKTHEGKEREDWGFNFGGGEIKPLENDDLKKLNTLFGKKLKRGGTPAPATSRPTPIPAPKSYAGDEEIPF